MPKARNKPNAFSVFCHDWIRKEEKLGRRFKLPEAISNPACNEAWRNLPDDQKARYKSLAKNSKVEIEADKKTGLGESLSAIEAADQKKKEFLDTMKDHIFSITKTAKESNCIQKLKFYVIHANYLYNRTLDNNEVEYYPAEICLARCCLENGIEDAYHVIVNEEVIKGYRNDANTHSKETHQIPIAFSEGTNSYQEIFENICKFLEPGRKNNRLPPIYTLMAKEDIYYPAKSILGKLSAACGECEEYLRLYAFEELFASMYNAVLEQSESINFESITALREIKKDPYAYKHGLECDFHKVVDAGVLFCSQSVVKRWFYVLCDFCCDPLDIIKVAGVHTPLDKRDLTSQLGRMNSTFSSLSLNDSRYSSTVNVTEINECRIRPCGRSAREELRRKNEARSKPVQIIDHSESIKQPLEVKERPLRRPFSKSTFLHDDDDDNDDTFDAESLDFSENSFPSIGRGAVPKKKSQQKKSAGHGYAGALKS